VAPLQFLREATSGRLWPEWRGDLLTGGLQADAIVRLEGDAAGVTEVERLFDGRYDRIRDVREAHPFYAWARELGVTPRWNFHKILLDGDGRIAGSFGTVTSPSSPALAKAIEALLPDG
jgi:hypothetical protein